MDGALNFEPKMKRESLINGYKHVLSTIYAPKQYYARVSTLLKEFKPKHKVGKSQLNLTTIVAGFLNSIWFLGIREKGDGISGECLLQL
jgi:hypothetical protein